MAASEAHPAALSGFTVQKDDFTEAVKNKKLTDSMRKSIIDLVDSYMEKFETYKTRIDYNQIILSPHLIQYPSLFVDQTKLLQMETLALEKIISARIATHKAEEQAMKAKAEAEEAKRFRDEEDAKRIKAEEELRGGTITFHKGPIPDVNDDTIQEVLVYTDPEIDNVIERDRASNRPIGGGRVRRGSDSTITQAVIHNEDDIRYILTAILSCSRDDAIEITKAVHAALAPFGGNKVISVNLDKADG